MSGLSGTPGAEQALSAAGWENPLPGARWLRSWRLGEWVRGAMSPLFATFLAPILTHARQVGGSARFGWQLPKTWRVREPCYAVVNGHFYARADPDAISILALPARYVMGELGGGWLARWNATGLPVYLARIERYRSIDVASTSSNELLLVLEDLALDAAELWYALGLASGATIPIEPFLRLLGGVARETNSADGDLLVLLSGSDSPLIREQISLYQLAQDALAAQAITDWVERGVFGTGPPAGADTAGAAGFGARLRTHIDRYGHQTSSLDFVVPCLAEQPDQILNALRCYQIPGARNPASVLRSSIQRRTEATNRVLARLHRPRRAAFRRLLRRAQMHVLAREQLVFDLQRGWPLFRTILIELGTRLVNDRVLGSAGEVFALERDELWGAFSRDGRSPTLGQRARERHAQWLERQALRPPTHIPPRDDPTWRDTMRFPFDLHSFADQTERRTRVVRGAAASAGQVRARARVLASPTEFSRLGPGEVLVAVATTPDWTPLFATAGAVVTDVGAVSTHASVVAREYGIPAVVGTQDATRVIGDGDMVTVDGSAGLVHLS